MKKNKLLHPELSHLMASLGHTDEITICDAGLPIPSTVKRIDLALTHGVPSFIQTVETILQESQIQGVILATEFQEKSPALYKSLITCLKNEEAKIGKNLPITYLSHEAFKSQTHQSKAIIRTGECTPYANIIFQSGVTF